MIITQGVDFFSRIYCALIGAIHHFVSAFVYLLMTYSFWGETHQINLLVKSNFEACEVAPTWASVLCALL